jgi:sugar lactone lactonase YvrE
VIYIYIYIHRFNGPSSIAFDAESNYLYVSDTKNYAIRRVITTTGIIYISN